MSPCLITDLIPPPIRSNIRPKISTLPRQQSEAAAYLEIYKLVVEKKRLLQELESIGQRRDQISNRLGFLEQRIQVFEGKAHELRDEQEQPRNDTFPHSGQAIANSSSNSFRTITLEY